jgi:hypothetical protein
MKWFRRKPKTVPPVIPPYVITETGAMYRLVRDVVPVPKPEPAIVVVEHDVSDLTKTGIHKAWNRLAGKK